MRRGVVAAVALAAIALALLVMRRPEPPTRAAPTPDRSSAGAPAAPPPDAGDVPSQGDAPSPTNPAHAARRGTTPPPHANPGPAEPPPDATTDTGEPPRSAWPLTGDGLRGAVAEVLPDLRDCYQVALEEIPDLAGRVELSFSIEEVDGVGQVTSVDVVHDAPDALQDAPLEACLLDHFAALTFDAPDGGTLSVNYPILFATD